MSYLIGKMSLLIFVLCIVGFGVFVDANNECFQSQSETHVPIRWIPGTLLKTGVYYTIDLKNTSQGRLTWSYSQAGTGLEKGNQLQIVRGAKAVEYVLDGGEWIHAQWMIVPSEEEGWYSLVNRGLLHAVTTWCSGESPSGRGHYVCLYRDKVGAPDYVQGGQFRKDALWKIEREAVPVPSGYNVYHSIKNQRFFDTNGLMTRVESSSEDSKFVQIYDKSPARTTIDELWEFQVAL